MFKIRTGSKGFTILEILMVLVLLGVLTTIAVPMFIKTIKTSRQREVFALLKLIEQAQKIYRLENNSYYPQTGSQTNISDINHNLSLDLNEQYWDFTVNSSGCKIPVLFIQI